MPRLGRWRGGAHALVALGGATGDSAVVPRSRADVGRMHARVEEVHQEGLVRHRGAGPVKHGGLELRI